MEIWANGFICLFCLESLALSKTLPKAPQTQALTALTSNFGLVWCVWFGRFGIWFSKLGWLGLVWLGRFDLVGLVW